MAQSHDPQCPDPQCHQPQSHHPVVLAHRRRRATDVQLRVADAITAFAGSMPFVYVHAAF